MRTVDALFLCRDLDMGGAERHWATLIPALREHGIRPRVIALEGGGRSLEILREQDIAVDELREGEFSFMSDWPLLSLRRFPRMLRVAERPDVIVSWSYSAHLTGALYARSKRVPHVINWHRQPGNQGTRLEEMSTQIAVRLGAAAIAVTDSQRVDLRSMGMPEERIRVVHNGTIDPRSTGADPVELRKELEFGENETVAVLVARLRSEKRTEDFVAAVDAARSGGANVRGVVVGDGPEFESLSKAAAASSDAVRLVGFQSDPSRYLVAADVVVLASEYEALPMSLIEAASCARPAIATDVGGVHEIVIDGETGLLVKPGDVRAIAGGLTKLAADPALRRSMGEAARARWSSSFTFNGMVAEYARLLSHLSGPPARWEA